MTDKELLEQEQKIEEDKKIKQQFEDKKTDIYDHASGKIGLID